jgi:anaerobic selenocysteine-containing dehydrogenase
MRRYGAFEIARKIGAVYEEEVPSEELKHVGESSFGRVYTAAPKPPVTNIVPHGAPEGDGEGRRPVGVRIDDKILKGFPTPSGKLEFYSSTLADWGWREHAIPGYIKSHVHPDELGPEGMVLISTFRLPVQIHTRSANAKWLDEIAHTNPLWIHPSDGERLGIDATDLVRVETEIGYFVVKPWITEGIRPGVVACSHHMGRWKLDGHPRGQGQMMATVNLGREDGGWKMSRKSGVAPYDSSDPDTRRIWWTDVGVHQNLTFSVHPDPISGQHCWHQAVHVRRAEPGDSYGDIFVDTDKAAEAYRRWLELTRSADLVSPDGTRRPFWLMRPLKPAKVHFGLPDEVAQR